MAKELSLFDAGSSVPAHLQGYSTGVSQALMAAVGSSYNKIGVKGSRFRQIIKGVEIGVWDENYLDVIIVGIVPSVSRKYYASAYDGKGGDNLPPTCYSADGKAPAAEVHLKQASDCGQCPQNIKGSKIGDNGSKGKACSYFRRLVVMLAGDDEGFLYQLDVAAMGLFGPSHEKEQRYNLNDYAKALENRKMDAGTVVTRLSFDTDESVPKLLFKPARYIDEQDVEVINNLNRDEITQYLDVSMGTVEASSKEDAPPAAAAPARQAAPKAAPKAKPAPVVQEVVDEDEQEEEAAAPAPPVRQGPPKPKAAAPAPQKPAPATAQKAAPVAAPKPKAAAPVAEVSSDDEMDAILDGLDL